jgi:hypothetical protein
MKQQRPAGLGKRDIAKFIDDDAIQGGQLLDDLPGVALGLLCNEGIDQIDGIIEAHPLAPIDQVGPERDGNVCLSSAGSTDEDDVVRVIGELA